MCVCRQEASARFLLQATYPCPPHQHCSHSNVCATQLHQIKSLHGFIISNHLQNQNHFLMKCFTSTNPIKFKSTYSFGGGRRWCFVDSHSLILKSEQQAAVPGGLWRRCSNCRKANADSCGPLRHASNSSSSSAA